MARQNLAGHWEKKPAYRWVKMVDGNRWRLLCRARKPGEEKVRTGWLGLPEDQWTEARSQDAANEWWKKEFPKAAVQNPEAATRFVDDMQKLFRAMKRTGIPTDGTAIPLIRQLWSHIDKIQDPTPATTLNSLGHWRDVYLKSKRTDGERTAGRFDNLRRAIRKLVDSIGEQSPVTALDWIAWDKFVESLKLAPSTKRDTVSDCREFCRYLERRNIIPEIATKAETKVTVHANAIEHFTLDELKGIVKKSTGMLKTFVLLFCNCGFRQIDVATLIPSQIKGGYIIRQRAKTEGTKAPTVAWKLWPETLAAIKEFGNKTGLLFTYEGRTWVLEGAGEEGKRKRDDIFRRELWKPFAKIHKPRLSADSIRGSCANLLKTDSEFTNQLSIQIKYMGQSPSGVALKHYIDPPQPDLDKAVMFLHDKLFG